MNDYERELMANGTHLIKMREVEVQPTPYIPNEPRIKVSPYAKFDKYHKKNRKRK